MIKCKHCGCELDFPGQECPNCHSRDICLNESISFSDVSYGVKKKNKNLYHSKKHPNYEEISCKEEIYRDTGEKNTVYRIENRVEDFYYEKILDSKGNVKIEKEEKLSDHIGHGAAKINNGGKS